jgi:hypothetical protein
MCGLKKRNFDCPRPSTFWEKCVYDRCNDISITFHWMYGNRDWPARFSRQML